MRGSENQDRVRQNQGSRGRSRLCVLFRISWAPCHLLCWPELRRGEVTCPPELTDQRPCISSQKGVAKGVNKGFNMGFTGVWALSRVPRTHVQWEVLERSCHRGPGQCASEVGVHLPPTFPPTGVAPISVAVAVTAAEICTKRYRS